MLRDFFKFGTTKESAEKRRILSDDQPPEFAREQNRAIIAYFRQNAAWNALTGTYSLRARPDLTGELHDLIAEDTAVANVENGSIYGWPVVANVSGILFAWTGGTSDVFLRLREDRVEAACRDGARVDPTYPPDWVNFYVPRLGNEWRVKLKRWVRISYEDSLGMGEL